MMEQEIIEKIKGSIENLKNKNFKIYFFTPDTKGYAKASVRYIYEFAMALNKLDFNPVILHEKNDYKGVGEWMGEDYVNLTHESIESQKLSLKPEDFILIPEVFGHVIEQISNLPCGKIVLSQSYDYILETLKPGTTWADNKFFKCITTTEEQKEFIKGIMKNITIDVLSPTISDHFEKKKLPCKPIISIHTREQRDTMVIIKMFYLKYPQFRWVTFRDMRGIDTKTFSEYLQDAFVSVWIDDPSSFGTFPLESMSSGTPVIGKVPNMKPSWMNDDNGIWTYDKNLIVDIIAEFTQNWLEDNISDKLYESGLETSSEYRNHKNFEDSIKDLFESYTEERIRNFESQVEIKETQETLN